MSAQPELPFARTAGPYERDVLAACYRMSGSVRDWLKELAVEVSVTALEGRAPRPLPSGVRQASEEPEGDLDERHEVLWLEPRFSVLLLGPPSRP